MGITGLKKNLWQIFLRVLSARSDRPFANYVQKIAYAVYRSTYNPNYHFESNGEWRVMHIVLKHFEQRVKST